MKRILVAVMVAAALLAAAIAETAPTKTPINLVTYGDATAAIRFQKIVEAFNAQNPDVELQVQIFPFAEYPTKLTVMLATGVLPDVFLTWAQYKPLWADQGLLMDIGTLWESSAVTKEAKIFPFMMDAAMYKGRIYGVPYDYSAMAMVLHMDALSRSGLPVPDRNWTVEDFQKYAIRLTRPQEQFYGMQSAGHWSTNNLQWSILFTGQGWLDQTHSEVLVDRPEYIKMLNFWLDLVYTYEAVPVVGKAPPRDTWAGGYAMWQGWVHYGARSETGPYDWTMVPFPKGPGGQQSFAQGHMWSIPADASCPELGWRVLEWFISPEGQRVVVEDGRQPLTANTALWNTFFGNVSPEKRETMRRLVLDTIYGENLIFNMNYWTAWADTDRIMNRQLQRVFLKQDWPENAMSQAAVEIRALLQ
jgi:multiple sugar transport system substrate-binding protein